jgi:uncharacterized membrane protein (UPF0127 family)
MVPVALVLLAVAGAGCASEPLPAAPAVSPPPTVSAPGAATTTAEPAEPAVVPEGFERVAATVTAADGTVCELCVWLADDNDRRARGLMFVTDLGDADGMAFRYDSPRTGSFWMKNTLLPLSIAFFDLAGAYLDSFDMEPCTADPCPTYRTPSDFLIAIEAIEGGLPDLGIGPGSTLALSDLPCV